MTYSVEWHPKVRNFLRKLPKNISARIVKKVKQITEKPFHYLEHYEGEDVYKLRIGDYRAVVDVIISMNKIIVVRIGHRKNIYD